MKHARDKEVHTGLRSANANSQLGSRSRASTPDGPGLTRSRDLHSHIWDPYRDISALLIAELAGACGCMDAQAAMEITRQVNCANLVPLLAMPQATNIEIGTSGMVILGEPEDYDTPALTHTVKAASFPYRFYIDREPTSMVATLMDSVEGKPSVYAYQPHLGLVFASVTKTPPLRPVTVFTGTSHLGLLAGVMTACNPDILGGIPAPEGTGSDPVEIVTRLIHEPRKGQPIDCGLAQPLFVSCGGQVIDCGKGGSWTLPQANVLLEGSWAKPRAIFINGVQLDKSVQSDYFRALWALAEANSDGKRLTARDIVARLDGSLDPKNLKSRTSVILSRIGEIHIAVKGGLLSEDTDAATRVKSFALKAAVRFAP